MKRIAVTYDNGQVFQHFGRTEQFKVFDVEDDEVVSSQLISSNGEGHGALAGVLANNTIDVLICGGIGAGAQAALDQAGIEVCAGASGDVDEVVESFLKGQLVNTGVNCDHHGESQSCGDHEGEHHCGGGCHGCGPKMEGKNVGKTLKVHYKGTFNDGSKFDSSYDRGEPLEFVCGAGMMISGFDKAVADMEAGEKKSIHLMPEEAYGMPDPRAIFTVDFTDLEGAEELEVGETVVLSNEYGQPFQVKVMAKTEANITFDANHEMAGKELNFDIELVEVV